MKWSRFSTTMYVGCSSAFSVQRGGHSSSSKLFSTTSPVTETISESKTSPRQAYEELVQKLESITHLGRAQAVLGYDQQVFMPASAAAARGAQIAALATVVHQQQTDPRLLECMELVLAQQMNDNSNNTDEWSADERRLLELEKRAFDENACVPSELAARAAALSSSAYQDWVQAREAKDFGQFVDTLQDCFDTAMAVATAKQGSNNNQNNLYDFMLDDFEVGLTEARIDVIFDRVQDALVPLIQKVRQAPHKPSTAALDGTFDLDQQQSLSKDLVQAIGFDADRGRIDVSVHPFTSSVGGPADVRITSRFRTDEWYQGLAGSLHEAGHAIYEQNLGTNLQLDTALSMGTHESQSLFWERHVGLSRAFWKFAGPQVRDRLFAETALPTDTLSDEDLYGAVNAIEDESLIRVEADELQYPLHVILRYNIEKDVIGGRLAVADIRHRWNEDMERYLQVRVPSDDKGCLQDVHWSALAFGYFPTYLIGAIAAAQLYHYCARDIPAIETKMQAGDFADIRAWLTDKVHRHGRRYRSLDALLEDQLGEPLNPEYFIHYLTDKYTDLYRLYDDEEDDGKQ